MVAGAHALAIFGLPSLMALQGFGQARLPAVSARVIAAGPPSTQAAPAAAPQPAVPPPEPKPVARETPTPRPKPTPRPRPPVRSENPTPTEQTATPSVASTESASANADSAASGNVASSEGSLLGEKSPFDYGPAAPQRPVSEPVHPSTRASIVSAEGGGSTRAALPRSAELSYASSGTLANASFDVMTRLNWRQDGDYYEASWPFYLIKSGDRGQRSRGLVAPSGLLPVLYTWRTDKPEDTRFDYQSHQLQFPAGASVPLPPGAQDPLSVVFQLSGLLAADPQKYPIGSTLTLPVSDGQTAQPATFQIVAEETMSALRDANLRTLHLRRTAPEGQGELDLWLAPSLDYLPARVRMVLPGGGHVEHVARQAVLLTVPPRPPAAPLPAPQGPHPMPEAGGG